MTALQTDIYEDDDLAPARRSALARLCVAWPVFTCIFLSVLFMLATNDPDATGRWQEMKKEDVAKLAIKLESGRESRQIAFLLMGVWGLATTCLAAGRRFRPTPLLVFPIGVFVAWAFLSLLWSPERSFTIKRLVVFGCIALAVFAFVRRLRLRDLALLALIGGTMQMAASVVFDLLYATGEYGKSGYRFSGLQHPNHSGINAVLLCFACLYFFDRTRLRRFLALFLISAFVLYMTKSRSSLIAGLFGIGAFALLRWPARNVIALGFVGAVGFCMFAALDASGIVPDDWSKIIHMGREDSQAAALTGRPLIWNAAFSLFGSDPVRILTGYGYDSFWTPARADFVSARLMFRLSEGHNGYLDMLFELGVVGVLCYTATLLGSLGRWSVLAMRHDSGAYAFGAAVMTFAVVHGLTESTTVDPNFVTFFSYATMTFLALRAPRSHREDAGAFA